MSDRAYIGRKMRRFQSSPQFDGYSRVIITVTDEIEYSAGTELGRTLRLTCPWGTQEMAENLLNDIRGFQYQPYTAESAILDPAVELGDGVTANNVYGGVYTNKISFGPLLTATVSAPEDEEINHEYPYQSKPNKVITREAKQLRSEMRIQADRITMEISDRQSDVKTLTSQLVQQAGLIEARVTKTGGDASSFGWVLDDSSWTIRANSRDILKATKDGLEVYGKVTATSGKIGGFDILSNYLSYNNQTWGGTNSTGIYIGASGIQCGSEANGLQITPNGYLYAESGYFRGNVSAGNIDYGGSYGTLSGSGITSGSIYGNRMVANTISTAYTSSGINTSLGRADYSYNVCTGVTTASSIITKTLRATSTASVESLYINGVSVTKKSTTFQDGSGSSITISYWG